MLALVSRDGGSATVSYSSALGVNRSEQPASIAKQQITAARIHLPQSTLDILFLSSFVWLNHPTAGWMQE